MLKFHAHYAGEGNASRRITKADKIKGTLQYKHECTMSFANFLDAFQRMCTIYEEEGKALTDNAKVRELLRMASNSPLLSAAIRTFVRCVAQRRKQSGISYDAPNKVKNANSCIKSWSNGFDILTSP